MLRSRVIAAAAAAALVLAGCGSSDEQDVARALESYTHSLAAGNGRAACNAFSPQGLRHDGEPGAFCAYLRKAAATLTPAQRRRLQATTAVVAQLKGDRAIAYLRFGNCTATASGAELSRNSSGHWQIANLGLPSTGVEPRASNNGRSGRNGCPQHRIISKPPSSSGRPPASSRPLRSPLRSGLSASA